MSEYYYMSSSLDENGVFIDYWVTSSSEPPCENCGPVTSSIEGEYILLDKYVEFFQTHLSDGKLSEEEVNRLNPILSNKTYVENDREFLQNCVDILLS